MAGIQRWIASCHSMINIEEWIWYTKQSMILKTLKILKQLSTKSSSQKILIPGHSDI